MIVFSRSSDERSYLKSDLSDESHVFAVPARRFQQAGSMETGMLVDMPIELDGSLADINWAEVKADLSSDQFDNGRSPEALQRSFEQSQHVAIARDGQRVVGMARLLSDGVCNAYLLDVWTSSKLRRQGIGTLMVRRLMDAVPGQHIGLQTDDAQRFYASLGFRRQPEFLSAVVGSWLDNPANG